MSVAGQAVTVVVGAHAAQVLPMLSRTGVSTLVNRRWEEGLGSSLRAGLASLPATCTAVLVVLGDQVEVTAQDLKRLLDTWKGQDNIIAAALYRKTAGVPALFPRWVFPELADLRGDRGARLILQRHADRVVHVPMPNAAVDLDTPEDLARLNAGMAPVTSPSDEESGAVAALDWSAQTWLLPTDLELIDQEEMTGESHAPHHRPK